MIIFTDGASIEISLLERLCECVKKYNPSDIVVREKALTDCEYDDIINNIINCPQLSKLKVWVNGRGAIASKYKLPLHIGYSTFCSMDNADDYNEISVAVHSLDEAVEAQRRGATRIVFGHIFATECKSGVAPRGLRQLNEIAKSVTIPLLVIGGINRDNAQLVIKAGASDFCIMSSAMNLTF